MLKVIVCCLVIVILKYCFGKCWENLIMFEFLCMVGVIVISLGFCVVILYSYFLKIVE